MAKKYSPGDKARQGKGVPAKSERERQIPEEGAFFFPARPWLEAVCSLVLFFALALAGSMDNIVEKWAGLLAAALALVLLLAAVRRPALRKRTLSPLFPAFTAYIVWGGISTFYAASGKFAIFEFGKLLVALCVFLAVLLLTEAKESGFKSVARLFARVGCLFGILSVDAASAGFLINLFRAVIGPFTRIYDSRGGFEQGVRVTGILGDPNTYAGFMALAVLLSLYLATRASGKKEARAAVCLLAVNALCYLLTFSMGSLFVFLAACLIMLACSEKGARMSLFLLMLETAVLAFLFAFVSMAGLGKTGAAAWIPLLALIFNAALLVLADERLRPALSAKLNANVRLSLALVLAVAVLISGYAAAALQISGTLRLNPGETVTRAIYVPGGAYRLDTDSSAPVSLRIESQNRYDLMRHTSSLLYSGTGGQPIPFTVPDDSEIVQVSFSAPDGGAELIRAAYSGAESGALHLNYPLLPDFIANRLQNLFANENAVQRVIFFEDGIKLFSRSPIIGRGLGGFENGVYAVQDFNYETKYAHNHYIQALSDLGAVGLILFLSIPAASVLLLVRAKKRARSLFAVPALAACTAQMFGQAMTDATWSTGVFLGFSAAILALIAGFCLPEQTNDLEKTGAGSGVFRNARLSLGLWAALVVFTGAFVLLLSGNLYAQAHARAGVKDFDDITRLMALDRFEYNDYKVSYLVNAPQSGNPEVLAQADIYALELLQVESNSIAPYVMAYNFETYKDADAFEAAKTGARNAASSPGMWIRIFDTFEEYIDPVGAHTDDAADRLKSPKFYVNSVLELYDTLVERNERALDQITLSPYNDAFIGKLLEIRESHLYSVDWVFTALMTHAFHSEYAADTDRNGLPDNLVLLSGSIERTPDDLLAAAGTTVELTLYHKLRGTYVFQVKTDTPQGVKIALDGEEQNVLYTDNTAYITLSLTDNSAMALSRFTVTFPAAAAIDEITFATELDL
jgi:hypothetical protein